MESVVLKSLKKKEQKLKKEEKKVIEAKAQFIMSHSKELIENIENNDTFAENLLGYLLSSSLDKTELDVVLKKENTYNYIESLSVIFKLCCMLPYLDYESEERENFRNKLRLYTKYFNEESHEDSIRNRQFVKISNDEIVDVVSKTKIKK